MMDSGGPPANPVTAALAGRSEVWYNVIASDSLLAGNTERLILPVYQQWESFATSHPAYSNVKVFISLNEPCQN